MFKRIQEAYAVLSNPERRLMYDFKLSQDGDASMDDAFEGLCAADRILEVLYDPP